MSGVPESSHGGGPAAGTYLPTGVQSGATLDTTTYADPVTGVGKLATLITTADDVILAAAEASDAHPEFLINSFGSDFLYVGDGSVDPYASGAFLASAGTAPLHWQASPIETIAAASGVNQLPRMNQVSPKFTIASGALPTVALVSGAGAQILTTRDAEAITPVTFNPTAGAAATCLVGLSPDNVTYSALGTETEPAGVALDGTIHLIRVRVPAAWYLKLTVVNATIGTTTYY